MPKQNVVDEFFLLSAYLNGTLSKCITRQVGAVLVLYNVHISDGYNGTPRGIKNCDEGGCLRCNDKSIPSGQSLDKCICIHAESNALLNAPMTVKGTTLYVTTSPCLYCAKEIIQAGIVRVVYDVAYHNIREIEGFFSQAKIVCQQYIIEPQQKKSLLEVRTKR